MGRVRWQYFLITLGCCLADISQVASGAMASAKSYSKRVWSRNVLTCRQLAQWPALLVAGLPSAYLASHDILETAGLHAHESPGALYGMLECLWADGLLRYVCLASVGS